MRAKFRESLKTGNGKLNLAAAVDAQVTADPVSLSFGLSD